jgi:tetratricopeptide (TPR) repeat protein
VSEPLAAEASKQAPGFSAFISHAKADAKKAQAIAEGLEKRGVKCWIAPRDVNAGRAYGDEIIRGIGSARSFVLVLSKASNDSAFVAREVERAVSKKKPIFAVRIADVQPAPALELFISGTQWIDAFPGRLATHVDRLANMLAEEEGQTPSGPGDDSPPQPPKPPRWAVPLGAAASVLLIVGAGIAFWPGQQNSHSPEDSGSLLTNPVWLPEKEREDQEQIAAAEAQQQMAAAKAQEELAAAKAREELPTAKAADDTEVVGGGRPGMEQMAETDGSNDTEMIVGGNPLTPLAAGDPDFRACEKSSGDAGIAACDRAIASGKFARRELSYLYSDRGFMLMQKGAIEAALVDLNKAIETDSTNFYAFWNRGAVFAAKGDYGRAQDDLNTARALNPDDGSRAKIEEALTAVNASAAQAAQPQASDPGVITDPSKFWGQDDTEASAAMQRGGDYDSFPADSISPAETMPASPALQPAIPAAPTPVPAR